MNHPLILLKRWDYNLCWGVYVLIFRYFLFANFNAHGDYEGQNLFLPLSFLPVRYRQFNRTKKVGEIIKTMIKEYAKQIMDNAIAPHLLTYAQSVPRLAPLQPAPTNFIDHHDVICHGISLWPVWLSCLLAVSLLSFLIPPSWASSLGLWAAENIFDLVSALLSNNSNSVISTSFSSTTPDTRKKKLSQPKPEQWGLQFLECLMCYWRR